MEPRRDAEVNTVSYMPRNCSESSDEEDEEEDDAANTDQCSIDLMMRSPTNGVLRC